MFLEFLKVVVMKSVYILLLSFLYCIIKIFNKTNTKDKQEKLLIQMWFSITPVEFADESYLTTEFIYHFSFMYEVIYLSIYISIYIYHLCMNISICLSFMQEV